MAGDEASAARALAVSGSVVTQLVPYLGEGNREVRRSPALKKKASKKGAYLALSGFVLLTPQTALFSLNFHSAKLKGLGGRVPQNATSLVWVGNRREPVAKINVVQPTADKFALTHNRRKKANKSILAAVLPGEKCRIIVLET
ncbi:hypothetical protein ATANTOWER_004837 [Ataeniobius toweri]|uniref:Uncharacterized protein n=1 Tax=Ataeniobius toweri TaxID=208326 RepID=A0ABU7BJ60_9TELE|nr:hypothetical protein [Ataeniobius toweri]